MISEIRKHIKESEYRFTSHAIERCIERDIPPDEVNELILSGEIIEDYPHDKYGASCLIRGFTNKGRLLHVLCSKDPLWIITAYDPSLNPEEWDENFVKRRTKP